MTTFKNVLYFIFIIKKKGNKIYSVKSISKRKSDSVNLQLQEIEQYSIKNF